MVYSRAYFRFRRVLFSRYDTFYYLKKIKVMLKKYDKHEYVINSEYSSELSCSINEYYVPKSIQLASHNYPVINKKILWNNNFIDSENEEYLHRWNWLLMMASKNTFNYGKLVWLLSMQKDWINSFQDEIGLPKHKLNNLLRWESYSIGERLSNSVILFHCYDCKPDKHVHQSLFDQALLLTKRMEYFGKNTCNHICNNARALYLCGTYFDSVFFKELAREVIFMELPKLVTGDGFLREGSSHYQLLFTRWMLEVAYFAAFSNDLKLKEFLDPYLRNLICKSYFFFVRSTEFKTQMPLFGDISPDFPPEWLINMLDTIDDSFEKNEMLPEKSWNRLWSPEKNPSKKIGLNNAEILSKAAIQSYPVSGWYKFLHGPFEIFIRLDEHGVPNYLGHHHQDSGHFCLYYEGIPILVDGGRLDYQNSYGVEPEAHNTLSLNGLGLVPRKDYLFPRSYSNCIQSLKYKLDKDYLRITLTSNGFSRIQTGLIWTRSLLINSSKLKMIDEFKGKGDFNLRSYLHFAEGTKISEDYSGNCECKISKINFQYKMEHINEFKMDIYEGGDSQLGWQVVAYGKKLEAPTIEISGLVSLPKSIVSTLNFK